MDRPDSAPAAGAGDRVPQVVRAVSGTVVLLMLAAILVAPRMPINVYDPVVVAAGVGLVALLWVLFSAPLAARVRRALPVGRRTVVAAAVLVLLNVAVAMLVAHLGPYVVKWDPWSVQTAAATPIDQWTEWHHEYFSRYPNNHALLGLTEVALWSERIGLGYQPFFVLVAGSSVLVTALALYRVVTVTRGPRWGLLALVLLLALVSSSPWMAVPYTDLIGLWVPVTAVWLVVAAIRRGGLAGLLMVALAGFILGLGFLLKTTPIVGVAATLVVLGVLALTRPGLRRRSLAAVVALALGTALGAVGAGALLRATVPMAPLEEDWAASPWTYVAGGLHTAYYPGEDRVFGNYGGYSEEVDQRTWNRPTEEQARVSKEIIRRELVQKGPWGLVAFEVQKLMWNNGDGMFWAYGEGADREQPRLRTGPAADALASVNAPDGRFYDLRVTLTQVLWLSVLLALGVGLVATARRRWPAERTAAVDLMVWTVIAIAAFMLLFQGRSRYLFGHVPMVVALGSTLVPLGVRRFGELLPRARRVR